MDECNRSFSQQWGLKPLNTKKCKQKLWTQEDTGIFHCVKQWDRNKIEKLFSDTQIDVKRFNFKITILLLLAEEKIVEQHSMFFRQPMLQWMNSYKKTQGIITEIIMLLYKIH